MINVTCQSSTESSPSYLGRLTCPRRLSLGVMTPDSTQRSNGGTPGKPSSLMNPYVRNANVKATSHQQVWLITSFHEGNDVTWSLSGLTCNPSAKNVTIRSHHERGGAVEILKTSLLQTVEVSAGNIRAKLRTQFSD
jgi:hypothetical protein